MSNTFPVLCVSVHHALGGRALWLIVLGHRNGPEAQAQATIAGYRLNRVLGGFSGHFALDARWSAYYLRVNEVVVVATYPMVVDGVDAMAAAGAARGALVEVCGGRQGEVSLLTLSRSGAEVQLALRRAVLGNGRVVGIGSPKFDVAGVQLSSEPPPDDATSVAMRASNDITSPTAVGASNDAWLFGCNKSNSLGEALTRVLRPTPAALGGGRDTWAAGLHVSSEASLKAYLSLPPSKLRQPPLGARSGSGVGGGRRPAPLAPRLDLLPKGVASALAALDQRGFLAGTTNAGGYDTGVGGGSYGGMWEPANSGGGGGEFISLPSSQAFAPPPIPHFTVTIRVAAQCAETATVTDGGAGGGSSCAISGVCTLRVMYGNALPGEVEESGHGPLAFVLHFTPPGPLSSLTHVKPTSTSGDPVVGGGGGGGVGGSGSEKPVGDELLPSNYSYKPGTPVVIPLTLPMRPPGITTYTPGDLGQLHYRLSPTFSPPPLLSVSASCKTTWGQLSAGGAWAPKHTDVLLKTCLDGGRLDLAPTLVHFLVALPPPPPSTTLAAPVCSPPAQWSAPRAQLLWSLGEAASGGDASSKQDTGAAPPGAVGVAAAAPPTVVSHFAPGKTALFRARAPIVLPASGEGVVTSATDPTGASQLQTLPVQARFSFSNGALAPVAFTVPVASSGGGGGKGIPKPSQPHSAAFDPQPLNADTDMSGMGMRVHIIGLLVKSSTNVRAMFK